MELTKAAIQRPVFVVMAMFAIFMMGFIAYKSMRVELNPDVSLGIVTVTTVYPGAAPDEVNTLISRKVEDAVSGISNLREVDATSQEGVSSVVLNFEVGTNMDVAISDVKTKVDAAVGSLPKDALKPVVDKIDITSSPVVTLAMSSDKLNSRDLRDLIDNKLADKFARIPGVAEVGVNGGDEREIQIRVKKEAMVRYSIGIVNLQNALAAATLNVPSGRVVNGAQEYTVRMLGEFKKVKDVEDMILSFQGQTQGEPTTTVRLGDIAEVKDTVTEVRSRSRLDGKDAIVVVIQKTKTGNAIDIANAIRTPQYPDPLDPKKQVSLLDSIDHQYGTHTTVTNDTSLQIRDSIQDLNSTLVLGIFLVAMVVWLFLHDWRGTLIVAIAIPVCIFATFIALQAFGLTINNMSLLALSLAVGVLVDDAIVVLENIYRHLQRGEHPAEAALNGRSEIGLAAIAITMADVVVFLPIGNMGGVTGQFFRPLGIGYAVCVLFSMLVSFTVTPMIASRWYKAGEDLEHPKSWFGKVFEKGFHRFADSYRRVLRFSLHHRWYMFGGGWAALFGIGTFIGGSNQPDLASGAKAGMFFSIFAVVLGVLIAVGTAFKKKFNPAIILGTLVFALIFPLMGFAGKAYQTWKKESVFKFVFIPPTDGGEVDVSIQAPPDSSLEYTDSIVKKVEQIAQELPDKKYVVANVGTQGGGFGTSSSGTQFAQVAVTLNDEASIFQKLFPSKGAKDIRFERDTTIAADLTRRIGHLPGADITVSAGGGGFGSGIQFGLTSDDRSKLLATAVKIRDLLRGGAVKGVIEPNISSKPGKQELRAVPDRERAAEENVSPAQIGEAMRFLYAGDDSVKFRQNGNEYPIRIMMDLKDRDDTNVLREVPLAFNGGRPVYLSEVATIEQGRGIDKIDRRDRQETISITAQVLPGFVAGNVQQEVTNLIKDQHLLPDGVTYKELGQADFQNREGGYLFGALGLGLILVFMILASLFDNVLYPFIIQLAQPQAMVGALIALVITDKPLNIVGMIGVIALVGLVGKNAILIVDYTNTLRARGESREEALVESGGTRIRPIMMTTLALLFGMLPVALALGRGSEFRQTIGITIIGGTLLSTVLSLLVIPCSYSLFDDAWVWIGGAFRRKPREEPKIEWETEPPSSGGH